jgi:DNA helicase MCM9
VCCIDEFTLLGTADRASIHESMEQQRLSVAKAGLVCSLPTRCSILAACNPQQRKSIDKCDTLSEATGIGTPLLSRFDLIFVLRDVGSAETDPRIASHVLKHFICKENEQGMWDTKLLKAYISCVREQFIPTMTSQASDLIEAYFSAQRCHPLKDPARTTMRFREGLVRLAEAHARLMAQTQVLVHDAVVAIALCDASMAPASLFKGLLEKQWEDIAGCIDIVITKLNKQQ